MAGATVKQILTMWKVDTSDWQRAISDVIDRISQVRAQETTSQQGSNALLDAQIDKINQSLDGLTEQLKARQNISDELQKQLVLEAQKQAVKLAKELNFGYSLVEIIKYDGVTDPGDMKEDDVKVLRREVFGRIC